MSREDRLRKLIMGKYVSLRKFAAEADIPYSTLTTLLVRGIAGSGFDTVLKICKTLDADPKEI